MARAKKKKGTKKRNKNIKMPSKRYFFVELVVLLFIALLFIKFSAKDTVKTSAKLNNFSKIEKTTNITPSPNPSVKPTPVITITQNEVPDNSYCLRVPVLMYHHIEPIDLAKAEGHAQLTVDSGIFDTQMKYLVDHGYRTISGEELANALINHQAIPGKPIVITLDDGYSDNYNYAFQIAKKYNVVLNLMIPTGLIGNAGYMSWENLKEMVDSGIVNAYDHTWSHYSLPRGDVAKDEMEIMTAKKQLEEHLGKIVTIFAYPYGSSNQTTVDILVKNGFIAAFSTIPSFYQCESYRYALRRTRIGNSNLSSYGL